MRRPDRFAANLSGLSPRTPALLLLSLNVVLFFAVLFNYLLVSPAGPMGRFFFPALPALAILMFYGLSLWVSGEPGEGAGEQGSGGAGESDQRPAANAPSSFVVRRSSLVTCLAWAANLGMAAFALVALYGYLAPAYARPDSYPAGADLPNPAAIQFDTLVQLRGYAVDTDRVRPGEPIGIELYWEVTGQPPGDYLLFVHLVDEATGALVAQRDTHPGLGNFPSSQWRSGDRFVERLSLYVPETAYTPAGAELRVGLYAPGAYRLGITDTATGAGLGDAYPIGRVAIEPNAPAGAAAIPNPGAYNFEDRLRLLGYDYDARRLAPGEPLRLTLHWAAARPSPGDYEVAISVLDGAGNVVAAQQARLSAAPTTAWQPDEVMVERYELPLPPLAAGSVTVHVALLDAADGRRLNLIGDDGRWLDDKLTLSPIMIHK